MRKSNVTTTRLNYIQEDFQNHFKLELTTFPGLFKQNYTNLKLHITLHIMFKYDMAQKEGEMSLKMWQGLEVF